MIKSLYLFFLLIIISNSSLSQSINFSVIDSIGRAPIPHVNISIYTKLNKVENNLQTDLHGNASFKFSDSILIDSIVINKLGFTSYRITDLYMDRDTNCQIILEEKAIKIEEVAVGIEGITKYVNDKIVFFPPKSDFNQTRSVFELFSIVPNMVSRNGTIYFRNDKNFLILIDGQGENKSRDEQLEVLKNMPIDAIHKIEIDNNPSSRYGNGIVAVVNILTKKDISYSIIRTGFSSQTYSGGQDESIPKSWNVLADSKFRLGNNNNFHLMVRENANKSIEQIMTKIKFLDRKILQYDDMLRDNRSSFYSLIYDREITKRTFLRLNSSFRLNDTGNSGKSNFEFFTSGTRDSLFNTENNEQLRNEQFILNPQLKYVLDLDKSIIIYSNPTFAYLYRLDDFRFNNLSIPNDPNSSITLIGTKTKVYFFDLIIDNVINIKKWKSSIGFKYNHLRSSQFQGEQFKYIEYQKTFFISNSLVFNGVRSDFGLSAEHLDYETSTKDTLDTKNKLLFYPKVSFTYDISEQNVLRLAYERNILRLNSIALNPQTRFSGYLQGVKGDQNRLARITDHFSANLYLNEHSFSINYKLHKNHTVFVPLDQDNPLIRVPIHYNYFKQLYFSYNKSFKPFKIWSTNIGGYYFINNMKSKNLLFTNYSGNNYSIDFSNDLNIGKNLLNLNLSYSSKELVEYGDFKPVFYNNVRFQRHFLDKKLNVSVSIDDFLGITKSDNNSLHPFIDIEKRYVANQRNISFQVIYQLPIGKKVRSSNYKSSSENEIRL